MELWDAYDINFQKLDQVALVRGEPIPEGMFHIVCDVAVRHEDRTYLLMQRDYAKYLGGKWELSAGGSALQGETPLECAFRELREETGIIAHSLEELGQVLVADRHVFFVEFLCITDCDKNAITFQEGETIAFRWISKDDLLRFDPAALASTRTLELLRKRDL